MGIFTFAGSWVLKKFRGTLVVQNSIPSNVSSLAIDMNGTIHRALAKVYHYGDFDDEDKRIIALSTPVEEMKFKVFKMVMSEIDEIIARIIPKETLVIAIDGPTNIAKMQQQRSRRYRSAYYANQNSFDTSIVTPGTDFMIELDEMIKRELANRRSSYPPNVIYSSHLVPGEGEHKLMEMYRTNLVTGDEKHVIYGLDADLILLSLISPQPDIILVREDRRELLDIDLFRQKLIEAAPSKLKKTAAMDFVILMTLVGNDFIPHGPLHQSMYELVEQLLNSYYELGVPLSIENNGVKAVNLKALGSIAKMMHPLQAERLAYEAVNPNFWKDKPAAYNRFTQGALRKDQDDNVVFDFDAFRSIWYTNAFGCNNGGNPINDDYSEDDITDMCESYCEGIVWCTRYYQTKDVNQKWLYKYYHAPLYIDLADYLMSLDEDYGVKLDDWLNIEFNLEWDALEQLACVMPLTSNGFPRALRKLGNIIPDMFPSKIVFESDGHDEVRNYNVIIPIITIDRMVEAVSMLKIANRNRWQLDNDLILDSTEAQQEVYAGWYQNQVYINQYNQKQYQMNRRGRGGQSRGSGRGRGRGGNRYNDKDIVVVGESTKGVNKTIRTHGRFI